MTAAISILCVYTMTSPFHISGYPLGDRVLIALLSASIFSIFYLHLSSSQTVSQILIYIPTAEGGGGGGSCAA